MRKRGFVVLLTSLMVFSMIGCSNSEKKSDSNTIVSKGEDASSKTTVIEAKEVTVADGITAKFSDFEVTSDYDDTSTTITLGETIEIDGEGAVAEGTNVIISKEGTYILSGSLEDGQIRVAADKTAKVQLVLNGVDITCTTDSPLYVETADGVVLTLASESENKFTDRDAYTGDGNACIYSKEDLAINGTGTLIVNGNFNNGIGSKNDLEIISGNIKVTALKNGLKGNDSVSVYTGTIDITAGKDAVKSDNEIDEGKGFVYIENADLTVNAQDDGIQAISAISYQGGTYTVSCVGKKTNCDVLENISSSVTVNEK